MKPSKIKIATFTWASLLAMSQVAAKDAPPPGSPAQPVLEIKAQAGVSLNLDPVGHPLSVVVRIYQLKDKVEFSKLTFDQASSGRPDGELLGEESLGKCEFTLVPGSLHASVEAFSPGVRYLGVVALFRRPDPNYWRCLIGVDPPQPLPVETAKPSWFRRAFKKKKKPLPPPRNPELAFTVQDCYLRLVKPNAEPMPGQTEPFRPDCRGEDVLNETTLATKAAQ